MFGLFFSGGCSILPFLSELRPCSVSTTGFFSDGGDCHDVQVVVVDRLVHFFGHRLVDFISVHNRRHGVLLAVNLTAKTVVELPNIFVATVLFKVPCVHINDQLVKDRCSGFLSSCGDFALVNEPLEILVVRSDRPCP